MGVFRARGHRLELKADLDDFSPTENDALASHDEDEDGRHPIDKNRNQGCGDDQPWASGGKVDPLLLCQLPVH